MEYLFGSALVVVVFYYWKSVKKAAELQKLIIQAKKESEASLNKIKELNLKIEFDVDIISDQSNKLEDYRKENEFIKQDLARTSRRLKDLIEAKGKFETTSSSLNELLETYSEQMCELIIGDVTYANHETSKRKIGQVYQYCRSHIEDFGRDAEKENLTKLKNAWDQATKREEQRQEQFQAKERMREELLAQRERMRELEKLEIDEERIQHKLELLRIQAKTEQSELKIKQLLEELQSKQVQKERAKSQAELTKEGNVYVISNVGSFGEGVFKVGMTRRWVPEDRVRELSDASVPFPFDIHMMIKTNDAPALENALHKALNEYRLNRVNLRKEYFKVDFDVIRKLVKEQHGEVAYQLTPAAQEYRETLLMLEKGILPGVTTYNEDSEEHEDDEVA